MSLRIRDKRVVVLVVWRIAGLHRKNQQYAAVLIRQELNAGSRDWRRAAHSCREHLAEGVGHGGGGTTHNRRHIVRDEVGDIHQTGAGRNRADETTPERNS